MEMLMICQEAHGQEQLQTSKMLLGPVVNAKMCCLQMMKIMLLLEGLHMQTKDSGSVLQAKDKMCCLMMVGI